MGADVSQKHRIGGLITALAADARKIPLPDFHPPEKKLSEVQLAQLLNAWNARAAEAVATKRYLAKLLEKLRAGWLERQVKLAEAGSILKGPNAQFARKAYDAARVADAVKLGLNVDEVEK